MSWIRMKGRGGEGYKKEEGWRAKVWHVWLGKETFEAERLGEIRHNGGELMPRKVPDTQDLLINIYWKS